MQKQGKQNVCILKELSGPTPACSHSDEYPELQVSHAPFPSVLHGCSSATALGQHKALQVRYYAWLTKTHNR